MNVVGNGSKRCIDWLYRIQKWSFRHSEVALDALDYGMPKLNIRRCKLRYLEVFDSTRSQMLFALREL